MSVITDKITLDFFLFLTFLTSHCHMNSNKKLSLLKKNIFQHLIHSYLRYIIYYETFFNSNITIKKFARDSNFYSSLRKITSEELTAFQLMSSKTQYQQRIYSASTGARTNDLRKSHLGSL